MRICFDRKNLVFHLKDMSWEECGSLLNMILGAQLPDRRVFDEVRRELTEKGIDELEE